MRITQRAVVLTSMNGLNTNLSAVAKLQEQLTSGKAISKPSDSPTGTNLSMQIRNQNRASEQHARNISDGKGWLDQSDSTAQTMLTMTAKVRDLALQAKNTGTMSASSAAAIAIEVATIREDLLGLANSQVNGRPIFGGVTGGKVAYDTATGNWAGDASVTVTRRVSDTEVVRIDTTGPEMFGTPGDDLFAVVGRIATDATANPAALAGHIDDLDVIMDRMLTGVADIGARQNRVDRAEAVTADRLLTLKASLSEVEGIDLPKTIMDLEMQKVGYQAALAATAKAIQPTLMDFLR